MARSPVCDICGKRIDEENPLTAKLFATLVKPGATSREWRNKYNAHMDVGRCCALKVNNLGKWQRRKARKKAAAAA